MNIHIKNKFMQAKQSDFWTHTLDTHAAIATLCSDCRRPRNQIRMHKLVFYMYIHRSMCYNIPKCLICMLYVWLLYLKRHISHKGSLATCVLTTDYKNIYMHVVQSFICSMNLYEYILHNKTSSYEHLKLTLMTKNNVKDMHTKHMVKTNSQNACFFEFGILKLFRRISSLSINY
jgi:hypothetical protein